MSGFASELSVFVGVTTSDIYSPTFRTGTVFLAAVGVILTPIYLLSMLRQVFYGSGVSPTCALTDAGFIEKLGKYPTPRGWYYIFKVDSV